MTNLNECVGYLQSQFLGHEIMFITGRLSRDVTSKLEECFLENSPKNYLRSMPIDAPIYGSEEWDDYQDLRNPANGTYNGINIKSGLLTSDIKDLRYGKNLEVLIITYQTPTRKKVTPPDIIERLLKRGEPTDVFPIVALYENGTIIAGYIGPNTEAHFQVVNEESEIKKPDVILRNWFNFEVKKDAKTNGIKLTLEDLSQITDLFQLAIRSYQKTLKPKPLLD